MLKVIYSMILHSWETHFLYGLAQVNIFQGKIRIEGENENEREERKSERLSAARKELWHWS